MITYTNKIKTVLDSVEKLIEDEFNIPVIDEHKGNESIVINPVDDTLIEYLSIGQSRTYNLSIEYTMSKAGGFENVKDHLTNRAERIKRLLFNNANYSPSGTYKFHEGQVTSITYEQDEDDPEIWKSIILFQCIAMEVI